MLISSDDYVPFVHSSSSSKPVTVNTVANAIADALIVTLAERGLFNRAEPLTGGWVLGELTNVS